MEKEIVWSGTAQNHLEDIYFYLLEETKAFTIIKFKFRKENQ